MNLIKYLLNGNYKKNVNKRYTEEVRDKFLYEEKQLNEIYSLAINSLETTQKNSA